MMKHRNFSLAAALVGLAILTGCASRHEPLRTVDHVDIERFMGRWYVVAHTATAFDRNAFNSVEEYSLRDDGRIATTYTFNVGAHDGPERVFNPVGTVRDPRTNARWDMQFLWPFQSDFNIIYLDGMYQTTVIGHPNRRFAWIMRREPFIEPTEYADLILMLQSRGFDVSLLRKVPHG